MQRVMTMMFSLPRHLDDNTVLALSSFLNDLNDAFDLSYGQQIRQAMKARSPIPDPHQPWLPIGNDEADSMF